jgi:hypothetical protein
MSYKMRQTDVLYIRTYIELVLDTGRNTADQFVDIRVSSRVFHPPPPGLTHHTWQDIFTATLGASWNSHPYLYSIHSQKHILPYYPAPYSCTPQLHSPIPHTRRLLSSHNSVLKFLNSFVFPYYL